MCVHSRTPWVSPTNSPVRLGVSPAGASTPTGVFSQRFEALFPCAGALGCGSVSLPSCSSRFLHMNVGPPGPPAAALPRALSSQLPISAPPTGLGECFFFISLVVGLPYSSVFWQFWLFFVFKFVVLLFSVVQGGKVCLPTPPSQPEV